MTADPKSLEKCGANFCPWSLTDEEAIVDASDDIIEGNFKTTDTQIFTLAGIYLAFSLLGPLIIAIFVDPLSKFGDNSAEANTSSGCQLIVATAAQMRKKKQLLLIPLTIWSGLEQGFFNADFTAGYVSCGWGVDKVGFVIITYGVCDAICSFALTFAIKVVGRMAIFVCGAALNLAVIIVLFSWVPNSEESYVFFILAGLWGISDGVWQTQINALYGVLFTGAEATGAFSNYRLWESAGFVIAYILQNLVCVNAKLWILVTTLGLGMMGYITVELQPKFPKSLF